MDTLKFIETKFAIQTVTDPSPFMLPIGRFKDLPRLFHELGFKTGVEVGVYRGFYSKYLLHFCPGLKLFGVDAWKIYGDYHDYTPEDIELAFQEAKKLEEKFDYHLIRGWSVDIAKRFTNESLDFVYIDGNHALEFVIADIAAWAPKVRKGGIVAGHDFDDYSTHATRSKEMHVIPAVKAWMESYGIHPWFVITNNGNKTWLYVKV